MLRLGSMPRAMGSLYAAVQLYVKSQVQMLARPMLGGLPAFQAEAAPCRAGMTAHQCFGDVRLPGLNRIHDRMVLVATEPLTRNEPWEPFAAGELRVFVDGEQVWQSAPPRAAARVEPARGAFALASVVAA